MQRETRQPATAPWRGRAAWLGLLTLAAQPLPAANALWLSYTNNPNAHPNIPNCSYAGYWHGERALTNAAGWTIFDVTSAPFNAYGDGTHDDSLAVWNALRAATNANGSVLYFPAGTYLLSTQLVISSAKVLLRGDGANATTLRFAKSLRDLYGGWWSYDGGLILFDGHGAATSPYLAISTSPVEPQRGDFTLPLTSVSGLVSGQFYQIKLTGTGGYDHTIATELLGNPAWASAYFAANPADQANITIGRPYQIIGINAGAKTVTLKEPLRFACRGIWQPELRGMTAPLSECGVEHMTIALARNYEWFNTNHTYEAGWNGIKFDNVINGFVRNVEVIDPDGLALILMHSKNITVTDLRVRASATNRQRHHYATLLGNSHDCLLEHIVVDSFPWHGLAMDQYSSGNAYSRCRLNSHGTLEYHGTLAYQNIRTEISLHNSGLHSGPTGSQPAIGGRTAHWNIDGQYSGPLVCAGDPSVLVQGALVGVQNMQAPAVTGAYHVRGYYGQYGHSGCAVEDSGLNGMAPAPANLYEAQKAFRLGQPIPMGAGGGSTSTGNDLPYTFAFPGAVTGAYLAGQDAWLTRDANCGFGILTNLMHPDGARMAGAGDPAKDSLVERQYDARWHATPFFGSETTAAFSCDILFGTSSGGINVGLMSASTEDGVLIIANPTNNWYLRRTIYGELFATNANPGPFSAGTWLRLAMTFDFTAGGGTGTVTVACTNLTAGGAQVILPAFDRAPLRGVVRHPWSWDTIVYRTASAAWANVIPNLAATTVPAVTIEATDPAAFIGIYDDATIAFTRTPATNQPLTVQYYVAGQSTARFGVDYSNALPGTVTIPAGESQAVVRVTALGGAATNTTVVLALQAAPHYVIGSNNYASVVITVPEPALLGLLAAGWLALRRR